MMPSIKHPKETRIKSTPASRACRLPAKCARQHHPRPVTNLTMFPVSRVPYLLSLAVITLWSTSTATLAEEPSVTARRQGKQIVFKAGDREIVRYQAEPG